MVAQFQWTQKRRDAAIQLAEGKTQREILRNLGIARRTLCYWLEEREFKAEVDRLSQMVSIAGRAERLRIAMRAVRAKVNDEHIDTGKDLLDWLKFAKSETDGINLGLNEESRFYFD